MIEDKFKKLYNYRIGRLNDIQIIFWLFGKYAKADCNDFLYEDRVNQCSTIKVFSNNHLTVNIVWRNVSHLTTQTLQLYPTIVLMLNRQIF